MKITNIISIIAGICAIATFFSDKDIKNKIKIFIIIIVVATIATNLLKDIGTIKNPGKEESNLTPPITSIESTSTAKITYPTETELTYPTETKIPKIIGITDMNAVEDNFYYSHGAEEDIFGNIYDDYVWTVVGGLGLENSEYEEYVTDKKYKKLTGILFVNKSAPKENSFRMKIYSDDNEIFVSPIIEKKSKPYSFDVDISGANFVKLEIVLIKGTASMESGWYEEARAFIANAKFITE